MRWFAARSYLALVVTHWHGGARSNHTERTTGFCLVLRNVNDAEMSLCMDSRFDVFDEVKWDVNDVFHVDLLCERPNAAAAAVDLFTPAEGFVLIGRHWYWFEGPSVKGNWLLEVPSRCHAMFMFGAGSVVNYVDGGSRRQNNDCVCSLQKLDLSESNFIGGKLWYSSANSSPELECTFVQWETWTRNVLLILIPM